MKIPSLLLAALFCFAVQSTSFANSPADSDGDGVNDYREGKDGTDPNNAASFDPLSKGLIALYTFNGTFQSNASLGADAIPRNSVNFVPDNKFGTVVKVQGADSVGDSGGHIELPEPALLSKTTFSASFWIKEHGFSYQHGETYLLAGSGLKSRTLLGNFGNYDTTPKFLGTGYDLKGSGSSFEVNPATMTEIWNHYVISETKGQSIVYRNGSQIYAVSTSGEPVGNWFIGRHWWGGGGYLERSSRLIASVANLRIYNRALSAAEVSQLYAKESGTKDSDNDGVNDYREMYDGTNPFDNKSFEPLSVGLIVHFDGDSLKDQAGIHNAVLSTKGGAVIDKQSQGYILDGFDDGFLLPDVNYLKLQSFSIGAWAKWHGPTGKPQLVLFRGGHDSGNDPFTLSIRDDGGVFTQINHGVSGGIPTSTLHSDNGLVAPEKWVHLIATYDFILKTHKLYLNGVKVAEGVCSGSMVESLPPWADPGWALGNHSGNTYNYPFNGLLDDPRFYNRALSPAEVSQLYAKESGKSSRYAVIQGNFTWDEAKADAEARGGHLATITSEAENNFLISSGILESSGGDFYSPQNLVWIGATDSETEGVWKWITGEPWGFASWGLYEPSNSGGVEDAALIQIHQSAGKFWNDASRNWRGSYLLEIEAPPQMITVQGGTLPSSSQLAGQKVDTFQIGKYEVTWGEWKRVRDWAVANGYTDLAGVGVGSGEDHPVRNVSWYDVVKWCNAKSQMDGLMPVYSVNGTTYKTGETAPTVLATASGYRLPAEAEWEWAAKGGIKSQGYNFSGGNELNSVAWNASNTHGFTQPVGTKIPNELGICDMSGNIWEWCSDFNSFPYNVKGYDKTIKYRIFKGFSYREQIGDSDFGGLGRVDYKPETRPLKFIYIGPSASNGPIATTDVVSVIIYGEIPNAKTDRIGFRLARNAGSTPDTTAPVVSVTSITANARLTSANATFSGSVVETGSKPSLEFRLGATGNWTAVTVGGSASPYSFSQRVSLKAGPNAVQFRAKDEAGNTSQVLSVPVSFVVSSVLNIAAPKAVDGSISSGFGGNSTREVGVRYTVKATPASGMLFKEWLKNGTHISTNASLTFTMEPGLKLVPVFVPDYAKLGGFYNGLVGTGEMGSGTAADRQAFAARNGFLQIRLGAAGALSGFLRIEGGSHPFSGTMGNNKKVTITVVRPGKTNATLNLNLVSALPGEISGMVGVGGASLPFRALRGGTRPGVAKHALGGKRYALVFPPPEGVAMGHGHGTLTVGDDGSAVLAGVLANGQAVNAGARVVDDGKGNWVVPVYVGGTGMFTGEIVIPKTAPASGSEIGGSLEWLKPASNRGLFRQGFLKAVQPLGASHNATSAGLGGAEFQLTLDPAKRILSAEVVQNGSWPNGTAPVLATPVKSGLTITFNSLSGRFEGRFNRTVAGATVPTPFQGTLFSRPISIPGGATLRGAGFFTSGNASTTVEITSDGTVPVATANMITVQGGTLPSSSELAGQTVAIFQIGKYEVTWDEWKEVRAWAVANGYSDLANVGVGSAGNHPVQHVNWYDVVKWINARSEKEGLVPVYQVSGAVYKTGQSEPTVNSSANGYRLPLEKEWEWAARGGVSSQGYTYSGSNDLNAVAWYGENSSGAAVDFWGGLGTWPVGQKRANELVIHDMSGNVWEWCWDVNGARFSARRVRGGSWFYGAGYCAVAYRDYIGGAGVRDNSGGFRLARNAGN